MKKIFAFVFCFGFIFSIVCTPFIVMAAYQDLCYDLDGDPMACPPDASEVYGTGDYAPSSGLYGTGPYVPPAPSGLSGGVSDVSALVSFLGALLNVATRLILGGAVVFFLWGVFQFVKSAGDEEARKTGKDHIIYGVIGIAIMVSMWGLVKFVTGSIGLDTTTVQSVPKLLPMPD